MPNPEIKSEKRFFIGANTVGGFVNYADEILNGLKRIYIIKGGPGTGKSTFMRKVAEYAESLGHEAERYFCSSDSDSLDAVVIPELGFGVIDGTAPHLMDPKYPGAREELLNLGEYWDTEKLTAEYENIKRLSDRKSELFATAYKYLGVCGGLRSERVNIMKKCTDEEKAEGAAARLIRKLGTGAGFSVVPRQISSLGMNGRVGLDTYREMCGEYWYLSDIRGVGKMFFEKLIQYAQRASLEVWVSRDPLLEVNALYFPEKKVAVLDRAAGEIADGASRIINTERFVRKDGIAKERARLRFLTKLETELLSRIEDIFSEIRSYHFALEDLYKSAMHFKKIDSALNSFLKKAFRTSDIG